MPIAPKFKWEEDLTRVTVTVCLEGMQQSNIHLFCSSALFKLNSPPYLLILDLFQNVDEAKSSAVRQQDELIVTLAKKEAGLWGRLTAHGDKSSIAERRNASVLRSQEKVTKCADKRRERKQRCLKTASEKQFGLEREKRRVIDARKEEELALERHVLAEWEQKNHFKIGEGIEAKESRECLPPTSKIGETKADSEDEHLDLKDTRSGANLWPDTELNPNSVVGSSEWSIDIKPVRGVNKAVPVYFTKLETPHLPAREQREEELKLYRKYVGENTEDLKIGERLPAFLKDKGDSLYAQGNYRGAINAYNRSIEMDPQCAMCIANRSACYLKLGDHRACIADCSSALKKLMSQVGTGCTDHLGNMCNMRLHKEIGQFGYRELSCTPKSFSIYTHFLCGLIGKTRSSRHI